VFYPPYEFSKDFDTVVRPEEYVAK
jgi:hypothetical protein